MVALHSRHPIRKHITFGDDEHGLYQEVIKKYDYFVWGEHGYFIECKYVPVHAMLLYMKKVSNYTWLAKIVSRPHCYRLYDIK